MRARDDIAECQRRHVSLDALGAGEGGLDQEN